MAKIVVTAGHSASDPGNTWNGRKESDLMTELRHLVAIKLRDMGHEVIEDGSRGVNQPLAQAQKLMLQGDVGIELHTNASSTISASGVEVIADASNRKLAQAIAKSIGSVMQIKLRHDAGWLDVSKLAADRGFTPGIVRNKGLIVEVFFQSNAQELRIYDERKWLVASAIARELNNHVSEA